MRYCGYVEKLCDRLIFSEDVTFADGTLTINIPDDSYRNGCQYCLVIRNPIPAATTITAPVVVTIGTGAVAYPLVGCNGAQLVACQIRTRTKYAVRVATTATGGSFRLLGRANCAPNNALTAIDGTAPVAAAAGGDAG